ncbi:MAG: hypothetical protein CVU46_09480 [Chloroflexi bacterium HGW-Chloroflexi-8]|nr:MAG: hypothetical protein CVU46_09480 [Chloroflexi bacterium HGW-Chloroflexi-8]
MIGLRFTDGTTTLTVSNLTDGILTGYQSGNENPISEETTELAYVILRGTFSAKIANINLLNSFFLQARERQQKPFLNRIYVERDSGDGVWWRSELVDGLVLLSSEGLDAIGRSPEVSISFSRKNYWEGAEVQIPLSNGNGTNNTGGLPVFNCNDGVGTSPAINNNFVQIATNIIGGDLLAPIRLEMTNALNSAARLYSVWIAHNSEADPANFQNVIEGESVAAGGSDVVGSNYSGGKYRTITWAGDNQVLIARWTLNTTYLNRAKSNWFKILSAFALAPSSNTRLQLKIRWPASAYLTEIGSSQEVSLDTTKLQDIGTLQLPPWLTGAGDQSEIALCLYARRPGGGTVNIDYLHITPLDSYRILKPQGYGAAYTIRIVDDGINELLYTDGWTPAGKTGHYVGIGSPVMLKPNKLQRIYFLQNGDTGDIGITRTMTIKAFYRPRRATI